MKNTRRIAAGAMLCALCTVLMLLGGVLELGMYAAPMLAGLCLLPYGEKYGVKYQFIAFGAVSLLSFMLVPGVEQNLMFLGFFGWYPMLRSILQKLNKTGRIILKLAVFNAAVIAVEMLVMLLLVPESMGMGFLILLLVLGNVCFILYDALFPRLCAFTDRIKKLL